MAWASDKDLPFAAQADVLGVRLDVSDTAVGVVKVANKPDRARDIAAAIDQVISEGHLDPKHIPLLFGRIQFSESQLMGRQDRLALAMIRWMATATARHKHVLGDLDVVELTGLRERMLSGRPREIKAEAGSGYVCIFTDGACDKADGTFECSVGGVLYRTLPDGTRETRAFGCHLDPEVVSRWSGLGKRLYAVVAARFLWKEIIDGQRVIYFVDHSGVLSAMIKGSSRDDLWRSLLLHYESFDSECPAIAWYARVPSKSNAADGPSRGGWRFPVVGSFVEDALRCFGSGKVLEQTGRLVQG